MSTPVIDEMRNAPVIRGVAMLLFGMDEIPFSQQLRVSGGHLANGSHQQDGGCNSVMILCNSWS